MYPPSGSLLPSLSLGCVNMCSFCAAASCESSRDLLSSMISVAISHTVSEQLLMDSCSQQQMQVSAGTVRQQGRSHGLADTANSCSMRCNCKTQAS
jgi:hypothetical protein